MFLFFLIPLKSGLVKLSLLFCQLRNYLNLYHTVQIINVLESYREFKWSTIIVKPFNLYFSIILERNATARALRLLKVRAVALRSEKRSWIAVVAP